MNHSSSSLAAAPALQSETIELVKILLVDDQQDNLLSAEAVLESLGQTIVKAESGREALRRAGAAPGVGAAACPAESVDLSADVGRCRGI